MLSNEGPALALADINLDGFQDLFFGSSSFNKSRIFMGSKSGNFNFAEIMKSIRILYQRM